MYSQKSMQENLVVNYLPLVKKQATMLHKKINYIIELEDLIQSGTIGLIDALDRFRDIGVAQFETYAKIRIHGAMVDNLRKMDVINQEDRSLLKKIEKAHGDLQNTKDYVLDQEVAAKCDINIKKYHELMLLKANSSHLSQDESAEWVVDNNYDIEKEVSNKQVLNFLSNAISQLPEREKNLMGLYYQEELSFKEVGIILELTEARVSQLHTQIVNKLKLKYKTL